MPAIKPLDNAVTVPTWLFGNNVNLFRRTTSTTNAFLAGLADAVAYEPSVVLMPRDGSVFIVSLIEV